MHDSILVRNTIERDFPAIVELCGVVYPGATSWTTAQLASHRRVFPEGQFVAEDTGTGLLVGMAASLIVYWDDYDVTTSWRDFTDAGLFTNHDPERGRTLYGAEIMVAPSVQGQGVGTRLYEARERLARQLGLLRIRAGARLRSYHKHAAHMSAREYTERVVAGRLHDATLSFQLKRGFRVIDVVSSYLRDDPESLGYAAIIEWLNPERVGQ